MTVRPQNQIVSRLGAGREAVFAQVRRTLAPLPEDARATLSGVALGGFGLLGAVCVALCLGADSNAARIASFLGFVAFAWAAVLVGEAVMTQRRDRLLIEREGLYLSHLGGRYFAPWRALGPFRVAAGVVLIDDLRLPPHHWRTLLQPLALDPAQLDLGNAVHMCAELNAAREAAIQEAQ